MKKLIVASTSSIYGGAFLEYLLPTLSIFFKGTQQLLFIPYARPSGISYDDYTTKVQKAFAKIHIHVTGIHQFDDPKQAIATAKAVFTGGGNTFELVNQLYKNDLVEILQEKLNIGTPYLGTSAGSNICGVSMMNTNDMPIVYPPSFHTLGVLPFNINAHYLDPNPHSTHMGETRATRIKEFHVFHTTPVLGLREGSWIETMGDEMILKGPLSARVFLPNKEPFEIESNSILEFFD